jgi:hypothetical protein
MAADTSMDVDMDFELDIDNDPELARLQAGTAALSAVCMHIKETERAELDND